MGQKEVAVARRFLEAMSRQDTDGMLAEVCDDLVFEVPFAPKGAPRRVEGKVAFDGFMRPAFNRLWSAFQLGPLDLRSEADPERVIAEYTSEATMRNGKPYNNTYLSLFTIRDGKIVEIREFFDAAVLLTALDSR